MIQPPIIINNTNSLFVNPPELFLSSNYNTAPIVSPIQYPTHGMYSQQPNPNDINNNIINSTSSISNNNNSVESNPNKRIEYSCRKCRSFLFEEGDIIPHERASGQDKFSWKKRDTHAR